MQNNGSMSQRTSAPWMCMLLFSTAKMHDPKFRHHVAAVKACAAWLLLLQVLLHYLSSRLQARTTASW